MSRPVFVEQAIYTSCQTNRAAGYQLVAASSGVVEADVRELSLWGPSHDSLWEPGPAAMSVNFHRLPSGAFCVSQTTPAGGEYSQRRGPQVYTQFLIIDAAGLAAFANNPFGLLQASLALGHVCVLEKIPKRLDPFRIDPEPQPVNHEVLDPLVRQPGPVWLGHLLELATSAPLLGIVAGERGAGLVAALVNCLPPECRTCFSFTTGLRFSPRRPYRMICLPSHSAENQRLVRQQHMTLFELKGPPPENAPLGGWASFITAAVASGNTDYLAAELARPRPGLQLADLNALGNQLSHGLRALQASSPPVNTQQRPAMGESPVPKSSAGPSPEAASGGSRETLDAWQRADAPHDRRPVIAAGLETFSELRTTVDAGFTIEEEPAREISESCPAALQNLQRLEDAIFEAMAGKRETLAELTRLWPQALRQVGAARADAAREQYLRYALAVWRQFQNGEHGADPARGLHAMEVICLLMSS